MKFLHDLVQTFAYPYILTFVLNSCIFEKKNCGINHSREFGDHHES
jgi:hypothetical protein